MQRVWKVNLICHISVCGMSWTLILFASCGTSCFVLHVIFTVFALYPLWHVIVDITIHTEHFSIQLAPTLTRFLFGLKRHCSILSLCLRIIERLQLASPYFSAISHLFHFSLLSLRILFFVSSEIDCYLFFGIAMITGLTHCVLGMKYPRFGVGLCGLHYS